MYKLVLTERANMDFAKLKRNEPNAFKKAEKLLIELMEHPRTGTGHIEQLKYCTEETWSRHISQGHRVVYRIYDDTVEVLILSAWGHYDDK